MNMLRAQRTSQDIAMMKYVFMRRDQGGFEVREIDSVKGDDAYIKQVNDILFSYVVYFEINHISGTLRTRGVCPEKVQPRGLPHGVPGDSL